MGPTRGNMELKAEISPEQAMLLREMSGRGPSTSAAEVARMVLALASRPARWAWGCAGRRWWWTPAWCSTWAATLYGVETPTSAANLYPSR